MSGPARPDPGAAPLSPALAAELARVAPGTAVEVTRPENKKNFRKGHSGFVRQADVVLPKPERNGKDKDKDNSNSPPKEKPKVWCWVEFPDPFPAPDGGPPWAPFGGPFWSTELTPVRARGAARARDKSTGGA
jgi:hypothetical protein